MTTYITRSSSHFRRKLQEESLKSSLLLCRYSNHIRHSTIFALFLILGCNLNLFTQYLFTIWRYLMYTKSFTFFFLIFFPLPPIGCINCFAFSRGNHFLFLLLLIQAHTSHTELLDLKPLPIISLGNPTYESLYNFSHFNPIQTQVCILSIVS